MNCTHADTLIQMGLDGRLTPDERIRLDAHLGHCPACRTAWDEHRLLTRTATDWARHPILTDDPGDAFTAQVMAQIAARPAPSPVFPIGRLCLMMVSVLSLIALSFWAGPLLFAHLSLTAPWPAKGLAMAGDATSLSETLRQFSHLPQDALGAWDSLTEHSLILPGWVWSALTATLALNGAFVWHTRRSQRTETA